MIAFYIAQIAIVTDEEDGVDHNHEDGEDLVASVSRVIKEIYYRLNIIARLLLRFHAFVKR